MHVGPSATFRRLAEARFKAARRQFVVACQSRNAIESQRTYRDQLQGCLYAYDQARGVRPDLSFGDLLDALEALAAAAPEPPDAVASPVQFERARRAELKAFRREVSRLRPPEAHGMTV